MKVIALVGNPNSGKTTLFNDLTGAKAHVGNWPGVTVEKRSGRYKKGTKEAEIIDLPGIYSLSPYSSEEVVARNYIIDEKPDCLINVIDATNLERNLYLTTQLLECDVPIVIALNMVDVLQNDGGELSAEILEQALGVPVIEISALKKEGLDALMEKAEEEAEKKRQGRSVLEEGPLGHLLGDVSIAFKAAKVDSPLFHAVKLIENDENEVRDHPELVEAVESFRKTIPEMKEDEAFDEMVADLRYRYIESHGSPALKKGKRVEEETKTDKADRFLLSRWFGIPFFVLILFLIFHFSFSTNFLFLQGLLPSTPSFASTPFEGLIWTEAGLNSPGEMLKMAVEGLFNLLSEGVASLFGSEDWWAKGLLIDGVIAGVGSVLSFIPQVLLVYLFFSLLEDSGYMARVCFLLDRIMRKFGLSGRALIPLIMGFGCSVPAMMNTRTLNNEKEKTMTLRVIPFFPCSAKLPILTGLAGALASRALLPYPDLLTVAMYVLCLSAAMLALILMSHTTMRGETPPFLMELPPYHRPQAQALFLHLWEKMKHFLVKAFTIILASTILVWFLMHFSFAWEYLPEERIDESILSSIGQFLLPVFTPLGFGIQTSNIAIDGVVFNFGWAFIVVTLTGLIAKENVIGVLSVVASCVLTFARSKGIDLGSEPIEALLQATGVEAPTLFSFIAFNLLTVPCVSAVATARSELTRKGFLGTLVFWIVFSFCFSAGIYVMLTWWWTVFPILGALVLVVILLYALPKPKKGATA